MVGGLSGRWRASEWMLEHDVMVHPGPTWFHVPFVCFPQESKVLHSVVCWEVIPEACVNSSSQI